MGSRMAPKFEHLSSEQRGRIVRDYHTARESIHYFGFDERARYVSQQAKKYGVSRSAIQRWMGKMGTFDKKLREMGGNSAKQEIQRLRQKIKDLETQKAILETAIEIVEEEYGVDVKKKFLPESLKDTLRKLKKR